MLISKQNLKLKIPTEELTFKTSRSSGPGGQNVNKLSTKVTVIFNVAESEYLTDSQKAMISKKLASRINLDGCISISSQNSRSQLANRIDATERLNQILTDALKVQRRRFKTKPTRASVTKRIASKKLRGDLKRQRSKKLGPND